MGLLNWLKTSLATPQSSRATVSEFVDLAVPGSWPSFKSAALQESRDAEVHDAKQVPNDFRPPIRLDTSTSIGLNLDDAKAAAATPTYVKKPFYGMQYDRRGIHGYRAATLGARSRKQVGLVKPSIESAKELKLKRKAHDDVPIGPEKKKVRFEEGHTELGGPGAQQSLILRRVDSISKKRKAEEAIDSASHKRQLVGPSQVTQSNKQKTRQSKKQASPPTARAPLDFHTWRKNGKLADRQWEEDVAKMKQPEATHPSTYSVLSIDHDEQLKAAKAAEARLEAVQAELADAKAELSSKDETLTAMNLELTASKVNTEAAQKEFAAKDQQLSNQARQFVEATAVQNAAVVTEEQPSPEIELEQTAAEQPQQDEAKEDEEKEEEGQEEEEIEEEEEEEEEENEEEEEREQNLLGKHNQQLTPKPTHFANLDSIDDAPSEDQT